MPKARFFSKLGLFIVPSFLSGDFCNEIISDVQSKDDVPVEIIADNGAVRYDRGIRNVGYVTLSPPLRVRLEDKIHTLIPSLNKHFGLLLQGSEPAQCLIYKNGCFYKRHRDVPLYASGGEDARKVSAVIFLNSTINNSGHSEYEGGRLTFYGLIEGKLWGECGLPLEPEQGMLIAFRSDIYHEVTPVTEGIRHTIVTWIY